MNIFFITRNKDKLRKIQALLPEVQGIDMDLTEIQELDAHKIIAAKLAEAHCYQSGTFILASFHPLPVLDSSRL